MKKYIISSLCALTFGIAAAPASALSDAADACINGLRHLGGPDGAAGEILSSEFSQAGTLVMMRDAGGTTWRCIAYDDGTLGELKVVDSASDDFPSGVVTHRVSFAPGTSSAEFTAVLSGGSSVRYVLRARDKQFLNVDLSSFGGSVGYMIYNPDGSELLGFTSPDTPYRGELWQTGDHIIQIFNDGSNFARFNVSFVIN